VWSSASFAEMTKGGSLPSLLAGMRNSKCRIRNRPSPNDFKFQVSKFRFFFPSASSRLRVKISPPSHFQLFKFPKKNSRAAGTPFLFRAPSFRPTTSSLTFQLSLSHHDYVFIFPENLTSAVNQAKLAI